MPFTGELIALATVLCWTVSVQFFEAASRQVGATPVNIIRLMTALVLFSLFMAIRHGTLMPLDFPARAWFYLGLSGVVGFFLGDIFLFKALVAIGPRVAMLIFSLSAPMAALIEWMFLDQSYDILQWTGIAVTLFGVCIVIIERKPKMTVPSSRQTRTLSLAGILFGFGAMTGQAVGYVLSKVGMQSADGYLDAFGATQIRALSAFFCFFILFTFTGKWASVHTALKHTRAVVYTVAGSVIGPFLGVSLSLWVLHFLSAGVASTFLSLVPVFIIPFSIFIHKEYVSLRGMAGAVIAVFGIYLLMN
ncbi:MAG: DMT family transporter [Desulfobacterales bacterium]|nr:DMT family transporter [Desulfobacterales bacterium]